jgi:hypothetical protein
MINPQVQWHSTLSFNNLARQARTWRSAATSAKADRKQVFCKVLVAHALQAGAWGGWATTPVAELFGVGSLAPARRRLAGSAAVGDAPVGVTNLLLASCVAAGNATGNGLGNTWGFFEASLRGGDPSLRAARAATGAKILRQPVLAVAMGLSAGTGLLALMLRGLPVLTAMVAGGLWGVVPASHAAWRHRGVDLQRPDTNALVSTLTSKKSGPPCPNRRNRAEPVLLTVYPESIAEAGLKGGLTIIVRLLPTAEEFQVWFGGVPNVGEFPTVGSPIVKFVNHLEARRKRQVWRYANECLNPATIDYGIEDFRTAVNLQVRSQAVLGLLRTYIEKLVGHCTTSEQAIDRLIARRKQAHPDRFCCASPDDSAKQAEVQEIATSMFQMLGFLANVLRDSPDFAARLFPGTNVKVWNNTVLRRAFPEGLRLMTLALNRLFGPISRWAAYQMA